MILPGHNAHCTLVQAPPVPADPNKGIAGSGATTRWQGDAQAYIDEDIVDEVHDRQRVSFAAIIVDLPVNLPIWPNEEDLVTIIRGGVLAPYSPAGPKTEVLKVRSIDGGFTVLGKLRLICVRA